MVARAGDGDVGEPAVLVALTATVGVDVRLDRGLELLLRLRTTPREVG